MFQNKLLTLAKLPYFINVNTLIGKFKTNFKFLSFLIIQKFKKIKNLYNIIINDMLTLLKCHISTMSTSHTKSYIFK